MLKPKGPFSAAGNRPWMVTVGHGPGELAENVPSAV
jgi:hypothetical protein